jgi:hypothetical protein
MPFAENLVVLMQDERRGRRTVSTAGELAFANFSSSDHIGSAAAIVRETGARTYMYPSTSQWPRVEVHSEAGSRFVGACAVSKQAQFASNPHFDHITKFLAVGVSSSRPDKSIQQRNEQQPRLQNLAWFEIQNVIGPTIPADRGRL